MAGVDCNIYRSFNSDLQNFSDDELKHHYKTCGYREGRIHNIQSLSSNEHLKYFILEDYKKNNIDLNFNTDGEYITDYLKKKLNEGRVISNKLKDFKNAKRLKFVDLLKTINEDTNYLTDEEKANYTIGSNDTESANEWGDVSDIADLIKQNDLVLNVGAGYRKNENRFFSLGNVINTEIFGYPTTDVVCSGDNLPFKDNSFDVVLSLAVLEHVKNPWVHANEMIRVLKPGGIIYADVPFLQPYHGYPYHYYNMTTKGLQNLFDKKISIVQHKVENWAKPVYTLTWFLAKYCEFLDKDSSAKFKRMTVNEILQNGNKLDNYYVKNMDKSKEEIIACGTTLIGKKL